MNSEQPAKKCKKDHVGNINTYDWDKRSLLEEVEGYDDNEEVSFRDLATKYNVCNKQGKLAANGRQIVKEWLISEGVDVSRFKTKGHSSNAVRRRKRRGAGGEISLPTEVTPVQLRTKLKDKVQSGEYTIGEMIVPRQVCPLDHFQ